LLTLRIARNLWSSILRGITVNRASKAINGSDEHIDTPREIVGTLRESLEESPASRPVLRPLDESVFIRQADYWAIRYQGQTAILKATRGLDCLGYLLRHPGQDVHVSELLGTPILRRVPGLLGGLREVGGDGITAGLQGGEPILDSQAKAEYKQRINELRNDLEEAERFNDSYRASRTRSEMNAIAEQLAVAVGLGGRDRRFSSKAERARSTVTKRIKQAINRITEAAPPLGRHLTARIKTGYFCSYNPHPDRPVAWKF
jgi:non-specific serine/threonine protein kinase